METGMERQTAQGTPLVAQYQAESSAPATLGKMRSHWRAWAAWAKRHDAVALPAQPGRVAEYLAWLASERGLKVASIAGALWGIDRAHVEQGAPAPGQHPNVRRVLAGIRRRHGQPPRQARPLRLDDLAAYPDDTLLHLRNHAVLLVGFVGLLRCSELIGLDVEDVCPAERGGLVLVLRRSKTDREHRGQSTYLPASSRPSHCAVYAVQRWIAAAGISEGPLFRTRRGHRLAGSDVRRIVGSLCEHLGLDREGYTTHSLRAGGATHLAEQGTPVPVIARQGRWKSADMVLRYCRPALGQALEGAF